MLAPRERVFAALTGGRPDRVPFVILDNKIPDQDTLRALLQYEACVTVKSAAYTTTLEGITVERESFTGADGASRVRVRYLTPAGPLTVIQRPMPGTRCGPSNTHSPARATTTRWLTAAGFADLEPHRCRRKAAGE